MRFTWRKLFPKTIKNKLFLSFLILILIPFSFLQLRSYSTIESVYVKRISEQNQYQLDQVKDNFERLRSLMFYSSLRLEKEPSIREWLRNPSLMQTNPTTASSTIDPIMLTLQSLKNDFGLASLYVNYTLSDLSGRKYVDTNSPSTDAVLNPVIVRSLLNGEASYVWETETESKDGGQPQPTPRKQPKLAFYMTLTDETGRPEGIVAVQFDYQSWLRSSVSQFLIQQEYFIVDSQGKVVFQSRTDTYVPSDILRIIHSLDDGKEPYYVDRNRTHILNTSSIPSVGLYLVGQFPLDLLFGDIEALKRQFFASFFLFTVLFILITFALLARVTRPLQLLRMKMSEMIDKQFRVSIPTDKYEGEILEFAQTFNTMTGDINVLIERLKLEERQKEAIRFQMLLQQMNPHFLLNTLNTIKWNVLAKGDRETAEICMSLGTLLEASLNSDSELIHLHNELDMAKAYAHIQQVRHEGRFAFHYELELDRYDPELQYALVPKLSLQPLVENAIQHGFSKTVEDGRIVIRVYVKSGQLVLEVEDNGVGLEMAKAVQTVPRKRKPIGIHNLQDRLKLLFRQEAALELLPMESGTLAQMTMPLLVSRPYGSTESTREG
ncbi:cache domain-containing sensor histidine kinase [Paenibacillus sp. DMB20]|uniref:cache domain-containing sensor histidine kinase n=1 Tax=Paenibacillus sp. DMB20 TaxID=1642570 RepID=UPI00062778CA|nr:sensor histidine kinase [Paenibacillus sp. DMB20]KKO53119.1 hypothetical protein XI25_15700 [Paenibacillus sp. DMB20]